MRKRREPTQSQKCVRNKNVRYGVADDVEKIEKCQKEIDRMK
jgi:hypothetical protein